jgi:integrase
VGDVRRGWPADGAVATPAGVPGCQECRGGPTRGVPFHDLRHYHASLLIASGLDVKVVQARLRHASAKTTLETYGHLWPDSDETIRAAVSSVMATRSGTCAAISRPPEAIVKRFP